MNFFKCLICNGLRNRLLKWIFRKRLRFSLRNSRESPNFSIFTRVNRTRSTFCFFRTNQHLFFNTSMIVMWISFISSFQIRFLNTTLQISDLAFDLTNLSKLAEDNLSSFLVFFWFLIKTSSMYSSLITMIFGVDTIFASPYSVT